MTEGGKPYPDIATKDLLRALDGGYRMQQPPTCEDAV